MMDWIVSLAVWDVSCLASSSESAVWLSGFGGNEESEGGLEDTEITLVGKVMDRKNLIACRSCFFKRYWTTLRQREGPLSLRFLKMLFI